MRVELIRTSFGGELPKKINDFIKDKNIIDIKYCENEWYFSALIIYEEKR